MKPIDREKLAAAVERAVKLSPQQAEAERGRLGALAEATKDELLHLVAKFRARTVLVPTREAFAFWMEDGMVKVKTVGALYRTDYGLDALEARLPETFLRVHRSAIVNLGEVREVARGDGGALILVLNDDAQSRVTVSERLAPVVRQRLGL